MESKYHYVRMRTEVTVEKDLERNAFRVRFVYIPGDTREVYGKVTIVSEDELAHRLDMKSLMDELMTHAVEEFVHIEQLHWEQGL